MKIRLKFSKKGNLRFIGHLDVMRYFQKLNRRAKLDIKYSNGFSPHQEMSFATPLGLGLTSDAEYVDIEFNSVPGKKELIERMNAVSLPELQIVDACLLPDNAKNAMASLAAADYTLSFREGYEPWKAGPWAESQALESCPDAGLFPEGENNDTAKGLFSDIDDFFRKLEAFLLQPEILTEKKTKTSVKEVDLAKQIRKYERRGDTVFLRVDTGSSSNLKPELVMEIFWKSQGAEFDELVFRVKRDELYGEEKGEIKALIAYGTDF